MKKFFLNSLLTFSRFFLTRRWLPRGLKKVIWNMDLRYLVWREENFLVKTRFGFQIYADLRQFIENRIAFFGIWEQGTTELFLKSIRPGEIVIDMGANIGYYTLLASRLVGPTGKVYAVEPARLTRERLLRNLELNHITNVVVLPYGAWDEEGETYLNFHTEERGRSSVIANETQEKIVQEKILLKPLWDLIPSEEYSRIRLVKMDVEGAEQRALKGLLPIFEANQPMTLFSEVIPDSLKALGGDADEYIQFLKSLRFDISVIDSTESYCVDSYINPHPVTLTPLVGSVQGSIDVFCKRS
ncbi:MAG: FkbM family methyltransferase [Planctomycetia bacterium]|nr:FkbM family methyltransferase [Planctomycetia bacterium]